MNKLIGNAVVGQSGGPTAAINATLAGMIRGVFGKDNDGSIKKLYGMRNGVEGLLEERLVELGSIFDDESKIAALERTPAAALGSCRNKLPDPDKDTLVFPRLLEIFKKYDIRYFFYIGGNDSMDTVAKLSKYTQTHDYEMCVIGVPKTIDNDLIETDHTPGYGSAAKYIAATMQEILRDCAVYTSKAVTIVEIMGRDSGWLTAASALGRAVSGWGPDLVYLPERNFSMTEFFEDLRALLEDHPNVVVAVSEGIHFRSGKYVCEAVSSGAVDVFGHKALSGTGKVLELAVREELGCKVRSVELNIPQRCAGHIASATDISEAVNIGLEAVRVAIAGQTCRVITLERVSTEPYSVRMSHEDVCHIANKIRTVDDRFINSRGNNVTDECVEYLLPLICGEVTQEYVDGIPKYFVI